jgi:hypothetical protein
MQAAWAAAAVARLLAAGCWLLAAGCMDREVGTFHAFYLFQTCFIGDYR